MASPCGYGVALAASSVGACGDDSAINLTRSQKKKFRMRRIAILKASEASSCIKNSLPALVSNDPSGKAVESPIGEPQTDSVLTVGTEGIAERLDRMEDALESILQAVCCLSNNRLMADAAAFIPVAFTGVPACALERQCAAARLIQTSFRHWVFSKRARADCNLTSVEVSH